VRDSTYVLDGLLYHESDLRIEEHYTDTAGFTDHVFALMHSWASASRRESAI
jgi:TnpA family transposase